MGGGGTRFDVVVVGASVAGCSAARLFARAGARVALVERRPDAGAYKVACTHAVVSSAAPAVERLGLAPLLRARGAVRIVAEPWTPHGGWIRASDDAPRGWSVTRRTLDPLLRELAAGTPGVELMMGRAATRLVAGHDGRPEALVLARRDGRTATLRAPLLVAADGRHSTMARLAGVRARVRPNSRFTYFAYWSGLAATDRARVWFLEPDGAALFPVEGGLTTLVAFAHRARLPAFRADVRSAYRRSFDALPGGPDIHAAEQVSKEIGVLRADNVVRPVVRPGLAFVGDAALSTDPLAGAGLAWAFRAAEWLVDATAPALLGERDLDAALAAYRRTFATALAAHQIQIAAYSTGRPFHGWERLLLRAAAHDPLVARAFEEVASRRSSPLRLLDPRLAPHVARGAARSW